ncbi:putative fatty acid-binding protein-like 5-like isoform 3 [Apostichopus japonicus]|uniref:Putative fatty acid-binding protein-like 5-like isoform 3 n=1 Tax=Stichopus japonicus TaxID=307972 RepID=A0A2G8JSZ0_STIJA|nr:putative fatty acid-binding protein-like 5-like isoform 3 [Apostichopus japonicus]
MAVKQFLGEWKHEKSEGMDDFLKAMNVGFVKRNLAKSTSPTFIFEADGEKVKFTRQSVVMTQISMVEFGVERIEKNPIDGKDVRVTDTLDGDVWNTV